MYTISNTSKKFPQLLKDIWQFKHLIVLFTKRELSIKYSQTLLKKFILILQPLLMMLVFSFFFGYILKWKSADIPYPIYVYSGLIIWNLFNGGVQSSIFVLIENATLIKNNNFPKTILTISKMLLVVIDSLINFAVLIVIMVCYRITPSLLSFFILIPIIFTLLFSFATAILIQAVSIIKRDIQYMVPYLFSILIWVTPVFFMTEMLPVNLRFILFINPITSLVELWRYFVIPGFVFNFNYFYSLLFIFPYLLFALIIYTKKESKYNDYL